MALRKDEVVSIDPNTNIATLASGRTEPLSEKARFELSSTQGERDIKQGVKDTELDFHKKFGKGGFLNTFLKNLGDNVFTRFGADFVGDPIAASLGALGTREGQEGSNYFERFGQDYLAQKMGRREAREVIDEENPLAALAGKAGALGIDVAMPLGRIGESAVATGALFGAGSSDRSLFEDPGEVLKNAAIGGGLGYGIGKATGALGRVASERKALRDFPKLQKEAERAHSQNIANFQANMGKKLGTLDRDIGKYGISKEAMNVEEFINREIGTSALAGTKESKELVNFITTVERSLPETLTTSDVQKLFEAIELRAARGVEVEIPVLNSFKEHLVATLPTGAAQNKLTGKIFPKIEKDVSKVVDSAFSGFSQGVKKEVDGLLGTKNSVNLLKKELKETIKSKLEVLSPSETVEFLTNGDVQYLVQDFLGSDKMSTLMNFAESSAQSGALMNPGVPIHAFKSSFKPVVFEVETRFQNLPNQLSESLSRVIEKNAIDASILLEETSNKVRSKLSNSTGIPNPFTGRTPTNVPVQPFNAPQAPQVGGMATRFESQPIDYAKQGTQAFGLGAVGKLIGFPKLGAISGIAKGAKAGFEGMLRGLTSPETLGNIARQGLREGGIKVAVEQISQTYPSYNRGIITDPQERVQAVVDIENNPDLQLEPKAMLQAYINRGKNIESLN